ncbi:hypothetical protein B9J78_04620 [bacterium Unc6]|nr:hypothetical protein [bacterium Unc6]
MFTGIVETLGVVTESKRKPSLTTVSIEIPLIYNDIKQGDSILVDGVCLTVSEYLKQGSKSIFISDIMDITLQRTTLENLYVGRKLNIERALRLDERLGGHFVTGHIDTIGRLNIISKQEGKTVFEVFPKEDIYRFLAPLGSVAVDGISLTLAESKRNSFMFHCIPHTLFATTLGNTSLRDVNIEVDIIARYVSQLISSAHSENKIKEFLNG